MQPPSLPDKDAEHIKLLAIFHYIISGLAVMGIGFLFLHYFVMKSVFANPRMWENSKNAPPPELFMAFTWFYLVMGLFLLAGSILNLLCAYYLQRRTHRTFCLVVAGLNCLQIPFGTALGVFTIIVLSRESVCRSYLTKTEQ